MFKMASGKCAFLDLAACRFVEVTDKHISKIKINSAQKKHKKPVYEHTKTIIRVMLSR